MDGMTPAQVSLMKQGFGLFAEDGSGKVTVEVLGDAMRSLGANPSRQLLEDIGKEMASTGGTAVDFPEFLTLLSRAKKATEANGGEDAELEQAFKVYNRSQTGVVTSKEIFDFYKSISQDVPLEDCEEWVDEFDQDKDGGLNFAEFCAMMKWNPPDE